MISIDITDTQIRALRCSFFNGQIKIHEEITRPLKSSCVEHGFIRDLSALREELLLLLSHFQKQNPRVILTIHSVSVVARVLELPKPKSKEAHSLYSSMILSQMELDTESCVGFSFLGEEKSVVRVYAAACPEELKKGYVRLMYSLPIRLEAMFLGAVCMERFIRGCEEYTALMPFVLIQNEAHWMGMSMIAQNAPTISIYTAQTEEKISRFHQISHSNGKPRALFYFGEQDSSLIQAGKELNLPVLSLKPPSWLSWKSDAHFYPYACCVAALWCYMQRIDTQNLIHTTTFYKRKDEKRFHKRLLSQLFISTLVLGGIWGYFQWNIRNTQMLEQRLKEESKQLQAQVQTVKETQDALDQMAFRLQELELRKQLYQYLPKTSSEVLDVISSSLEEGMTVTGDIRVINHQISLSIKCSNDQQPTRFIEKLMETEMFEKIQYGGFQKTGDTEESTYTYQFSIIMLLKGGNTLAVYD